MQNHQGKQEQRKRTTQRNTESQMERSRGHRQAHASSFNDRPKFFKLFRPASSSHKLSIPPDFVKHFNGRIPEKVYLIDRARKSWCVQLQEEIGGSLCFTNGWECFKSSHFLNFGDFLTFEYNRSSSFEVEIFDRRGCRKEEPIDLSEATDDLKLEQDNNEEQNEAGDSSEASGHKSTNLEKNNTPKVVARLVASKTPHFVMSIVRHTLSTVYIHISVVKAFNIALKPEVVLRNHNGKSWPGVSINFKEDGRIAIGSGWSHFAKKNVKVGDQCVFEFVLQRGNTCEEIRVHVLRGNEKMKKPSRHWHWHRQVRKCKNREAL